jgi:hypothetical protein
MVTLNDLKRVRKKKKADKALRFRKSKPSDRLRSRRTEIKYDIDPIKEKIPSANNPLWREIEESNCVDKTLFKNVMGRNRVKVMPSLLGPKAGDGLYATRALKVNAVVAHYKGKIITSEEASLSDSRYIAKLKKPLTKDFVYVDAQDSMLSFGRFINDPKDPNAWNVKLRMNARGFVEVVAISDILPGDEYYLDYGNTFWG